MIDRRFLRAAEMGFDVLEPGMTLPGFVWKPVEETLVVLEDLGDPGISSLTGKVDAQINLHGLLTYITPAAFIPAIILVIGAFGLCPGRCAAGPPDIRSGAAL